MMKRLSLPIVTLCLLSFFSTDLFAMRGAAGKLKRKDSIFGSLDDLTEEQVRAVGKRAADKPGAGDSMLNLTGDFGGSRTRELDLYGINRRKEKQIKQLQGRLTKYRKEKKSRVLEVHEAQVGEGTNEILVQWTTRGSVRKKNVKKHSITIPFYAGDGKAVMEQIRPILEDMRKLVPEPSVKQGGSL